MKVSVGDRIYVPNEKKPYRVRARDDRYIFELLQRIKEQDAEIERLKELVDDMGDYFPACIECEGKTPLGERTDKCVYLIDNTNYCTKRGITNIVAIQNENCSLKESLKTAKAEAYKEFAERLCEEWLAVVFLNNKSDNYAEGYHDALCFVEERIDNLLKEKVGVEDERKN